MAPQDAILEANFARNLAAFSANRNMESNKRSSEPTRCTPAVRSEHALGDPQSRTSLSNEDFLRLDGPDTVYSNEGFTFTMDDSDDEDEPSSAGGSTWSVYTADSDDEGEKIPFAEKFWAFDIDSSDEEGEKLTDDSDDEDEPISAGDSDWSVCSDRNDDKGEKNPFAEKFWAWAFNIDSSDDEMED